MTAVRFLEVACSYPCTQEIALFGEDVAAVSDE